MEPNRFHGLGAGRACKEIHHSSSTQNTAPFNPVEIQEVAQRLVDYEFKQFLLFLLDSGLDLVVTNTQKRVASCNISRVVIKTLERIGGKLRESKLMAHLREEERKFDWETLLEQ